MKELSIEEKARRYDEALEKARQLCAYPTSKPFISDLLDLFPELAESEDEGIRKALIELVQGMYMGCCTEEAGKKRDMFITWLEKQGENTTTLPKWKYKKDNAPLLRDSIILNKYGCVAKSPSGALVSDVWVIDYDELAKLPKEEFEKQGEQKQWDSVKPVSEEDKLYLMPDEQKPAWSEEDENGLSDALWCCKQAASIAKDENDMGNVWFAENWLKSLKNRYTWEPSDEQMEVIAQAVAVLKVSGYGELGDRLGDISEKLNKLKG